MPKKGDAVLVVRVTDVADAVRVYRIPRHLSLAEAKEKLLQLYGEIKQNDPGAGGGDAFSSALETAGFHELLNQQVFIN